MYDLYNESELKTHIEENGINIDTINKNKNEIWCDLINYYSTKFNFNFNNEKCIDLIKKIDSGEPSEDENNVLTDILDKINNKLFFKVKSIKILQYNPRRSFYKKVQEQKGLLKSSDSLNKNKIFELRKQHKFGFNKASSFDKYIINKETELNLYKNQINESEKSLLELENNIINKINNTTHLSDIYKINRLSDDYFMKQNQ